ncbi:MAG: InlB B-repeat-containing protein, partial [Oscillospiraceae bacterium]|nr:InlB B-repeat-containing protein [Oscillospiraceae bacterium]
NSTLKCIVTSSVQTGSIVSAPTAYVTKGDNLDVPTGLAGVAPTTLGGNDCYITGTTTAMEWSKYTDFHSTEGACSDGQTQVYHPGTYYVRYRQTSTYNAGTNYATVIVPDFGGAATYTVSFEANGGTGTMADVNGVAGTYTLPENGFTAPDGKQFKAWAIGSVGGTQKMPGEKITVNADTVIYAIWETIPVTTYTVSFEANGGSVTPANATTEATGKLATLPTPTRSGSYTFKGWYTAASGGTQVTVDKVYTENTTIYAQWNYTGSTGGGGGVSKYTIKFETNGGTTVANKSVTRNAKLAEPTAPTKDGFKFDGWYTDKELKTAYDFDTKVTKSFTLYAKWTEIEKEPENEPDNTDKHNCPSEVFDDLDVNAWYHEDIDYALDNGIFKGVTEKEFAPNNNLTRAMMVTVLYRAEGEPAVNSSIPFADVDKGAYYANAVIWGQQNGIIKGYSETEFGPDDKITREQIAAIMHRYAQYKGYDVSIGENTNILSYDDFDSISEYAIASMQYACGSGLMKGKTASTLNPKDNATRAEIAAILHRFIEANK